MMSDMIHRFTCDPLACKDRSRRWAPINLHARNFHAAPLPCSDVWHMYPPVKGPSLPYFEKIWLGNSTNINVSQATFDRSYQDWESASGKWSTCPKRKACRVKTCSPELGKLRALRDHLTLQNWEIRNQPVPEESLEKKPSTVLKPRSRPCAQLEMDDWRVPSWRHVSMTSVSTTPGLGQVEILWMPKLCGAKATKKTWQLHEA